MVKSLFADKKKATDAFDIVGLLSKIYVPNDTFTVKIITPSGGHAATIAEIWDGTFALSLNSKAAN